MDQLTTNRELAPGPELKAWRTPTLETAPLQDAQENVNSPSGDFATFFS